MPLQVRPLPYITVQHDVQHVLSDVEQGIVAAEDFWVSCYVPAQKGVHGKVRVLAGDAGEAIELEAREGITCEKLDSNTLLVSCPPLSISPTRIALPRQTLRDVHPKGIECLDVAGDLLATGGKNGSLRVDSWKGPDKGKPPRSGRGHVGDLNSLVFFPSGQVLLTASTDLSARVFAATVPPPSPGSPTPTALPPTLSNPRTFLAPHTRGVTMALPLGRGRFIITAASDGFLRVWEVRTGAVVAQGSWPGGASVQVGAMAVGRLDHTLAAAGEPEPAAAWPPSFLSGSLLALALSSGDLHLLSLLDLEPLPTAQQPPRPPSYPAPLDALSLSDDSRLLAVGARNGIATVYSRTAEASILVAAWRRTEAGVRSLQILGGDHILVGGADGLPYKAQVATAEGEVKVVEEWAGFDTDPVEAVKFAEGRGFAGGRDGSVRVY